MDRAACGGEGPRAARPRRGPARTAHGRLGTTSGAGCVLAAFLLLQCGRPVQVGQKAPDFVLADLKGGAVSLEGLRGKLVFLHFWATWCPPCLVELPGLMRFVDGLDKNAYALLAVCVDNEPPEKIGDFLRSWGAAIPVYLDPGGSLARQFGTFRFPETYVLDPQGRVCSKVIGMGDWEMSKWAHILHTCALGAGPATRGVNSGF
jgi:peroxiredoxin